MKLKYYLRGLGIGIILTTLVFLVTKPEQKLTEDEIKKRAAELGMTMERDPLSSSLDDILNKSDEQETEAHNLEEGDSEGGNSDEVDLENQNELSTDLENTEEESQPLSEGDNTGDELLDNTEDELLDNTEDELLDNTEDDTVDDNNEMSLDHINTVDDSAQTEVVDITEPMVGEELEIVLHEPYVFTITEGLSSGTVSIRLQEAGIVDSSKNFNEYMISIDKVKYIRVGTYQIPRNASYEEISKIITKQS